MDEEKKELPRKLDFEVLKVTNPLFLGSLGEGIQRLANIINIQTITYETLYTYFLNTIQNGGDFNEFWIAMNDNLIYAYAHWFVRGLPHRGVVCCDFIHACRNRKDATNSLAEEFFNFGVKHRCPIYEGQATNEKTYRVFRKLASLRGFEFKKVEMINFMGKRKS